MSIYGDAISLGTSNGMDMSLTNLFNSESGATSGQLTDSILNYKLVLIECTIIASNYKYKTSRLYSHDTINEAVVNGSTIRLGSTDDASYCWISFSSNTEFSRAIGSYLVQNIWGIN